ncbi:MAG TPA: 3-phosphoshikimate 1-carboxyvinyltransferase, partial [Peptostreptococcaceae bacterium]|nr:3-phosphoshikimate 1-carboxyvinyltransferase [Peptostreptococcaceae bacterium]
DAKQLKIKESNRIKATVHNLKKMGADIEELEDGRIIKGKTKLKGTYIESYKDHRIAMAMSIASLIASGNNNIDDSECVNISFPGFYDLLDNLTI